MKFVFQRVLLIALALTITACGDDDKTDSLTGPGTGGTGGTSAGSMTATVDGVSWEGLVVSAISQGGIIAIGGADLNGLTGIGIGFAASGTGTYAVGPGQIATASVTAGVDGWSATAVGGSGSITVTALTSTGVAGTFTFTAVAGTAGTTPATRAVTGGSFDVQFQTP